MRPDYFAEIAYNYIPDLRPIRQFATGYEARAPGTEFEYQVQQLLAQAHSYFDHEELSLALHAYRELRGLILAVAHPELHPGVVRRSTGRRSSDVASNP